MSEKAYSIDVSLGFKPFNIRFPEFDDTVTIYFNPTDMDMPKRMFEAQKRIEAEAEDKGEIKLQNDGTPIADQYIEEIEKLNKVIYDAVDYAFGNKVSDAIFKYCSPYAVVGGRPFIVQVFENIAPAIQKCAAKERAEADKTMNKYMQKYGIGRPQK